MSLRLPALVPVMMWIALAVPRPSLAQNAAAGAADGEVCRALRRELDEQREAAAACARARSAAEGANARCTTESSSYERRLDELNARLEACGKAREDVCAATTALVQAVNSGKSAPPANACVPAAEQAALAAQMAGTARGAATLARLEAYVRGESDTVPAVRGHPGAGVDALSARLAGAGRGTPLVYRRLLVEAVRRIAPRFWKRLRASGRDATDAWFGSNAELEPAFVTEAESSFGGRASDEAGPPQSAALRLVQSYLTVAGCQGQPRARECQRAHRLQELLESSATLIVRQRVQEIWYTACEAIGPRRLVAWLRDFPAQQPSLGKAEWAEITQAAYEKLTTCYLALPDDADVRFGAWFGKRLPSADEVDGRTLERLDDVRGQAAGARSASSCLAAVETLKGLNVPSVCSLPIEAARRLRTWFEEAHSTAASAEGLPTKVCTAVAQALWMGQRPHVAESFPSVPTPEALVRVQRDSLFRPTRALRAHCDGRTGSMGGFAADLAQVADVARAAGEDVAQSPWRYDAEAGRPRESAGFARSLTVWSWLTHAVRGEGPCEALDLPPARCRICSPETAATTYDCALHATVQRNWRHDRRLLLSTVGLLALGFVGWRWGRAQRVASRRFGSWRKEARAHLRGLGFGVRGDRGGLLLPSRRSTLRVTLPASGGWERWGRRAAVIYADGAQVNERDVSRAAVAARAFDAELALLAHAEGAAPDLAAVRAMLDWAARGPRRAVQVLPFTAERLRWARSADDLLDLVEQTSLRGNPFEMRGRLVSSSQFFNRERLVSGLLAASQAGDWTIVTGLRRFGKSSLALEVARRLQGPHAYVDLAGFHHEIAAAKDVAVASDAILRFVCQQLAASVEALYPGRLGGVGVPPVGEQLDSGVLGSYVRALVDACRRGNGDRPVTALVIFDEVEQAIGVGPERITHALDVLSIVIGRLRTCLTDSLVTQGGDRIGVLFCCALHPLLWAPLATLNQQSLLGAFPSVFVPTLPDDAAYAMMRGLGARQGIRFTDPALALIVREAQGIPMLVRRIGSAVLELYDPERARQGSLGAVEIGIEGASAAVRREEEQGAPLRVWVESEIGDPNNPAGTLLRLLAQRGSVPVSELRARAASVTKAQFESNGIAALLSAEEVERRAGEAAGYIVRMLSDIGLLVPEGDLTRPEALRFPDSVVRRILAARPHRDSLLGF